MTKSGNEDIKRSKSNSSFRLGNHYIVTHKPCRNQWHAASVQDRHPTHAYGDKRRKGLGRLNSVGTDAGVPAIGPLTTALKDDDSTVRSAAARVLGHNRDTSAVEALILALRDREEQERSWAATSLGEIAVARAVEPLGQSQHDPSEIVRWKAANAFGNIGDARAVEPLIEALKDSDNYVCIQAVQSLANFSDSRAIVPLIEALHSASDEGHNLYGEILKALTLIGAIAVEPLRARLFDSTANVRLGAAWVLGKIGETTVISVLEDAVIKFELYNHDPYDKD